MSDPKPEAHPRTLTPEEIEQHTALVKDTLMRALDRWATEPAPPGVLCQTLQDLEAGELAAGYDANLANGLGRILYQYIPITATARMLFEVARSFDAMTMDIHNGEEVNAVQIATTGVPQEWRNEAIIKTAREATYALLSSLSSAIAVTVNKSFEDALDWALTLLQAELAKRYQDLPWVTHADISAVNIIEEKVQQAAEAERARLSRIFGSVPGVRTHKTKGRPTNYPKPKLEQMLRRAISSYKRKNYGQKPSLAEAAAEIGMPLVTLKKLLLRKGMRYSTYKKET